MACLPGYGEWNIAKPKLFLRSDPPFPSMTVDFDHATGSAEQGMGIGREPLRSPLTNIRALSQTKFSADYALGKNKGSFEAEIDDHRRLDITFTGTVETSCMGEPIRTRPPGALVEALRGLDRDSQNFALTSIGDAGTQREYAANVRKFNQDILADVRKGKLTTSEAVRAINTVRNAITGVLAGKWLASLKATAAAAPAGGGAAGGAAPRWGHLGKATIAEAFGNPKLPDETWVHFASSKVEAGIRANGVTTTSKSSWLRWGEAKSLTHGELVWKLGPMAASAESDLGVMAVAPASAAIQEVKGLYGFKVEGEATANVPKVEVFRSSEIKALAEIEKAAGKTLAELEEQMAIKLFRDAVKDRPAPAGSTRVFDKLTKGEQGKVRLEIVEASMPQEAALPRTPSRWGKIGKCLMVVSIAISVYRVTQADDKLKQAAREVVGFGSGMAAGAGVGVALSEAAPNAAPILITLGALIGGILGAMGADYVFEWADSLMTTEEEY